MEVETTMSDVVVDDPAPWVELLPADVPEDYRRDVRAEARSTARHVQVAKIVTDLEAKVASGLADPAVHPQALLAPASELAAARAIASVLPAVVPVNQGRHDAVAVQLPRPRRGLLPCPPAWCGELVHHQRTHSAAGEVPPQAGPLDFEAIEAYERVSAEAAAMQGTLAYLDDGPRGQMSDYVTSWSAATKHGGWAQLHAHIADLVVLVTRADAARPVTGPCSRSMAHHSTWRLQPAVPGESWTWASACRDAVLVQKQP
jgi:hypothetical protein